MLLSARLVLGVISHLFCKKKNVSNVFFLFCLHLCRPQVVPNVVQLVHSLKTNGLPTSKVFLLQFTELIHCMMYQFSGFPDLYDQIIEAIKVRHWICVHVLLSCCFLNYFFTLFFFFLPLFLSRICQNQQKRRSSWC